MSALMSWLSYVVAAVVGVVAGMGINALADSVIGDDPPRRARECATCGASFPAPHVPAFVDVRGPRGWRGTCPACGKPTSPRRPVMELALALLLPLVLAHALAPHGAGRLPVWAVVGVDALALCVLAFIFVVDLEHRLIYDVSVYPLAAVLLAVALLFDRKALPQMLFGAVLCGGLFLLFYLAGFLIYHQEALGFGDVKLALLVGLIVGWPGVTVALVLTAICGAAVSVLLLGLGVVSRQTFIPFGIFLAMGAALALLQAPPMW